MSESKRRAWAVIRDLDPISYPAIAQSMMLRVK